MVHREVAYVAAVIVGAFAGSACGGDSAENVTGVREWQWIEVSGASCRDGSPAGFAINRAPSSSKLLVYLTGGAACSSSVTCAFGRPSFDAEGLEEYLSSNPYPTVVADAADNPLGHFSFALVPDCTGDVHSGNHRDVVVDGVSGVQQFVGYANMTLFLERIIDAFHDLDHVVLMGCSAGGFGAVANASQVQRAFGSVPLTIITDGASFLPDPYFPATIQELQRQLWNLDSTSLALCDADCPDPTDYLEDSFASTLARHPDRRFGIISHESDPTLSAFWGVSQATFAEGSMAHVERMRGTHPNAAYYVIPGEGHCVSPESWPSVIVGDVTLGQWITSLVDGDVLQVGP